MGREDSWQGRAGGPSQVADCGVGWAKLQLTSKAAAGGLGDRSPNPGLQHREIKPQTTDGKHLWGLRRQHEKFPASQESPLERPTGS